MESILLKEVAEILNLSEQDIERASLKTFLEDKHKKLLIEQLQITRKYGIKNVDEMERFYTEEKLSERESWEDYFELTHIESEIESVKKALQKL